MVREPVVGQQREADPERDELRQQVVERGSIDDGDDGSPAELRSTRRSSASSVSAIA